MSSFLGEPKKVQANLGCLWASLGSLSESSHVFDRKLLQEIIVELGEQLQSLAIDVRLADLGHTITLVDGTLFMALPRINSGGIARCDYRMISQRRGSSPPVRRVDFRIKVFAASPAVHLHYGPGLRAVTK